MPAQIDHATAARTEYDVLVVGSGVSGAIVARASAEKGLRVLVVEAGPGDELSVADYESYLTRFYGAAAKDNNSAYEVNPNAPMPRSPDVRRLQPGHPDSTGYLIQNGPYEMDSTYTRVLGGTTMHWEGKALRMLPEDFEMRSRFGQGRDWPLGYDDLEPYYRQAELELGVSADVADQTFYGITFPPGYEFPMHGLPKSYLDQIVARDLDGTEITLGDTTCTLTVRPTAQARNSIPNAAYDGGKGYVPVGAVSTHQVEEGGRCQGNINCVPLCPVQAKYNARKTLAFGLQTGRVDILSQTIASQVHVGEDGLISHIDYQAYGSTTSPEHVTGSLRARAYVLAANPVENARLLLASGLPGSNGLVGRNLMDHAYLLTWALLPEIAGTMRGSQCTSGIEDLRAGGFRKDHAAMRVSIHNDGWAWPTGSPYTDLVELVDDANLYGAALRRGAVDRISRQLMLSFMVELMPEPSNRITVDSRYVDAMGNLRPVLSYSLPEYTMDGVAASRRISRRIFQRLGAEDRTHYDPLDPGYVAYQGEGFVIRGGNHWAGTHIMGESSHDSVVDVNQRSWDHANLYLVGPGSMPSIGTSNTTLTLAALSFRTAESIAAELTIRPTVTIGG
ncbi:GMC family oxidoreductase [Nocardioides sp. cx-173]|uniref:GMC family oxidoreductase n=1 Tax=Nocardioides sp. cx-173 TaxID=2898796 RepID=UPI001E298ABD|nr:GMC family oxidoreductase [Nocardioides sp. cx-173]MCD4526641.1 GMC family oxidoreductase [Nocardioides sp. cx-173]UGB40734.1 GMC family oxidoreductase [Nocardioides sp. cx-173]